MADLVVELLAKRIEERAWEARERNGSMKRTAKVTFTKLVQDSQEYGSDDEHMVSRVFMDIESDGVHHVGLTVDIKLPVGGDYERDPLEVSTPRGYDGSLNYAAFREEVERYFRGIVGGGGQGIKIINSKNIRMQNNTFGLRKVVTFQFESGQSPAW